MGDRGGSRKKKPKVWADELLDRWFDNYCHCYYPTTITHSPNYSLAITYCYFNY